MAATASSVYPPVDARSIRLLHLEEGQHNDPIHFSLVSVSLDSNPTYEAVSYCWGDRSCRQDVSCMGTSMSITTSLWGALQEFRHSDTPRILWVDGICINQDDEIEKTCQVRLMKEIYAKATLVLVWLGPMDEAGLLSGISTSLKRLEEFLSSFDPELPAEAQLSLISDTTDPDGSDVRPKIGQSDLSVISELIGRPWFVRKWVVQEVATAREVRLHIGGGFQIPWLYLDDLACKLFSLGALSVLSVKLRPEELQPFTMGLLRTVVISAVRYGRKVGRGTLVDVVKRTNGFLCSDPRDHVYGLLSCAGEGPSLDPDYTLSVEDTFKAFTRAMLEEGQSYKVLSLEAHKGDAVDPRNPRTRTGLPSWVSDLRRPTDALVSPSPVSERSYHAGGQQKPVLSVSGDGNFLHCQGIVVDEIEDLVPSMYEMVMDDKPELFENQPILPVPVDTSLSSRARRVERWIRACFDLSRRQASVLDETNRKKALSCAILCDQGSGAGGIHSEEMINGTSEYVEYILFNDETLPLAQTLDEVPQERPKLPKQWINIESAMDQRCTMRNLSVTTGGRLGQMPIGTERGDLVCILIGGQVPFVVRPTEPGSTKYRLIGDCFLNGVMHGEMLEANEHATKEIILA